MIQDMDNNDANDRYHRAMLRFLADMREVDEEMANGGKRYDEDELKVSLGLV